MRAGSSFSGYDDTPGDNSAADAADPPAAGPEPSAAPGSPPAAAGPHVTAGEVDAARRIYFSAWRSKPWLLKITAGRLGDKAEKKKRLKRIRSDLLGSVLSKSKSENVTCRELKTFCKHFLLNTKTSLPIKPSHKVPPPLRISNKIIDRTERGCARLFHPAKQKKVMPPSPALTR